MDLDPGLVRERLRGEDDGSIRPVGCCAVIGAADVAVAVTSILIYTIPGVLIGGQLGPRLVGRIPEQMFIRTLGWLFLGVAALTAFEAASG